MIDEKIIRRHASAGYRRNTVINQLNTVIMQNYDEKLIKVKAVKLLNEMLTPGDICTAYCQVFPDVWRTGRKGLAAAIAEMEPEVMLRAIQLFPVEPLEGFIFVRYKGDRPVSIIAFDGTEYSAAEITEGLKEQILCELSRRIKLELDRYLEEMPLDKLL